MCHIKGVLSAYANCKGADQPAHFSQSLCCLHLPFMNPQESKAIANVCVQILFLAHWYKNAENYCCHFDIGVGVGHT